MTNDPYHLKRFLDAQATSYDRALFLQLLERFYDGERDARTLQLLR